MVEGAVVQEKTGGKDVTETQAIGMYVTNPFRYTVCLES